MEVELVNDGPVTLILDDLASCPERPSVQRSSLIVAGGAGVNHATCRASGVRAAAIWSRARQRQVVYAAVEWVTCEAMSIDLGVLTPENAQSR